MVNDHVESGLLAQETKDPLAKTLDALKKESAALRKNLLRQKARWDLKQIEELKR